MENIDVNKKQIKKNVKSKNANVLDRIKYLYYIIYPDLKKYFEIYESKVNLEKAINDLKDKNIPFNQDHFLYIPFVDKMTNATKELFNCDILFQNKISQKTIPALEEYQRNITEIMENLSFLYKIADVYSEYLINADWLDLSKQQVISRLDLIELYIQRIEKYLA